MDDDDDDDDYCMETKVDDSKVYLMPIVLVRRDIHDTKTDAALFKRYSLARQHQATLERRLRYAYLTLPNHTLLYLT